MLNRKFGQDTWTYILIARDEKKKRYADALAEDMEGFAVATACVIHSVPWVIVRGISNHAGDRDKTNWQADRALQKTAERVSEILAGK